MKLRALLGATLLLTGCENVETAMQVIGAAASEGDMSCEFKPDGDVFLADLFFDAAQSDTFALNLRVRNTLQSGTVNFGGINQPDNFQIPAQISPLRMDFRWECDTNGFSDELGPLYVPQFSAEQPFCQQKDVREFQGFDVVPASGPTIEAGEIGLVFVRPITTQLARALGEVFLLANLANQCCEDIDGCTEDNLRGVSPGSMDACGELQAAFDTIAPDKLSVNRLDDVEKFRPFRIYDWASDAPRGNNGGGGIGAGYPVRLRGVLEGATGDGSIVSSTEYFETLHICANCVQSPCTAF